VSDLRRSVDFYCDVLGGTLELQLDGVGDEAGFHDLPDVICSLAMVRFPSGVVELLEYRSPADINRERPGYCDLGSAHLAFEVKDVEEVVRDLRRRDVRMIGQVLHVREGPAAGTVIAFGQDPDGNRIEFQQIP
jgi:catechol 2,3-dioxygenase-like lactoylglutathione lyase family enzyme